MPRSMIADVVSLAARAAAIRGALDRSKFCGPSAPALTARWSIEIGPEPPLHTSTFSGTSFPRWNTFSKTSISAIKVLVGE
jgi:hypothetical protein